MTHRRTRARRVRPAVAALTALLLVAASCGRDDKDNAATTTAATSSTAAPAPSSAAPASSAASDSSAAPSSSSSSAESTTTTEAGPGPGDFGSLKGVCGPGDAKGATEQGVTDSEIVVGSAADPGNQIRPGLGQEMFDAATTFVKWCNEAGGINGRKLKLNLHDAKIFDAGPAMVEACQSDFMLIGSGMALDTAAVEPRVACGLTQIAAYTQSKVAGRAEGSIEAAANSDAGVWDSIIYHILQERDPEALKAVAFWGPASPASIPVIQREMAGLKTLGFDAVDYQETPLSVDNWRPFVEKLKEKNVQLLSLSNTAATLIPIMKSMDDVGYFPKYISSPSVYEDQLINEVGPLLDKTTVLAETKVVPFEMADQYPAVKQFVELTKANGGKLRSLGVNAFSAWLLFGVAAGECGSNLTRACVMDKAVAVHDWTAGGLHRPSQPGPSSGAPNQCSAVMHATSKGFALATEFYTPNTNGVFLCDPSLALAVESS